MRGSFNLNKLCSAKIEFIRRSSFWGPKHVMYSASKSFISHSSHLTFSVSSNLIDSFKKYSTLPPSALGTSTSCKPWDHVSHCWRNKSEGAYKKRGDSVLCRGWKKKDTMNVGGRAKKLISIMRPTSDVKEEVYAALDLWCAWESVFPLLAVKTAITYLKRDKEWKRVVQVIKWMLAKGQGKTLGTFGDLIEAYNELDRLDEMEDLWLRVLQENLDSVPRTMFKRMMKIYEKRGLSLKVLEVWGSMDAMGVKPDEEVVSRVSRAFLKVGAPSKAEELRQNYPLVKTELRYVNGEKVRVKVGQKVKKQIPDSTTNTEKMESANSEESLSTKPYMRKLYGNGDGKIKEEMSAAITSTESWEKIWDIAKE